MADADPKIIEEFEIKILKEKIEPKLIKLSNLLPGMKLVGSIGIMLQADNYIRNNKNSSGEQIQKNITELKELVEEYIKFGDYDFDVVMEINVYDIKIHKAKLEKLMANGYTKKKKGKSVDDLNETDIHDGIKLVKESDGIEMDYIGVYRSSDDENELYIKLSNNKEFSVEGISKLKVLEKDKEDIDEYKEEIEEDKVEIEEEIEEANKEIEKTNARKYDIKQRIKEILKESEPVSQQIKRSRMGSPMGRLNFGGGGSRKKKTSKKSKRSNKRKLTNKKKSKNHRKSKNTRKPKSSTNRKNKKSKRMM